jgi:hypothetical protein
MITLHLILLILALLAFVMAAFNVQAPRGNLMALGLALWVLAILLPGT